MPSYESDVKPLLRERDRQAILSHFDPWSYDDGRANADAIRGWLAEGIMPCDGARPDEQLELFRDWLADGASM